MRSPRPLVHALLLPLAILSVAAAPAGPADAREYTKLTPKEARGPKDLVIVLGGDVSYPLGKYERYLEQKGPRLLDPVRPYFRQGDLVFVNLEGPLTDGDVVGTKTYQFTIPPHRLDWLLDAGVNLLSLANNHIEDAGVTGVEDTLATLRRAARKRFLRWSGVRLDGGRPTEPVYFRPAGKDLEVAFIAATYRGSRRVATTGGGALLEDVRAARRRADLVIVSVHYGLEYVHVPRGGKQKLLRAVADAGAHVVVGHHPHVVQGVERRGDGIIFYSLGNLSFSSKTVRHRAKDARMYGMLPLVEVKGGRLHRAEIVPLWVNNTESWTLPVPTEVARAEGAPTDAARAEGAPTDAAHAEGAPTDAARAEGAPTDATRAEGATKTLPRARFRPVVLEGVFADAVVDAIREWSAAIRGNRTTIHKRHGKAVVRFDD